VTTEPDVDEVSERVSVASSWPEVAFSVPEVASAVPEVASAVPEVADPDPTDEVDAASNGFRVTSCSGEVTAALESLL
jgi:hypothetical protein